MHIHVPKPLHGWKAFFNEIMVIVIGILVALGLEAVVEWAHWQHKAADGRERLRAEIRVDFTFAAEMATVTPCILRQLDNLQAYLADPQANRKPFALDRYPDNLAVLRLPTRPWAQNTWEALQQDGTSSHLSAFEQRYLGALYGQFASLAANSAASGDAAGRLLVLGFAGQLDSQTLSNLRIVAAEQYRRAQYMGRVAGQVMATARDLGFAPEDDGHVLDPIKRSTASNTIGFCQQHGYPISDWKTEMNKWPPLTGRAI